MFKIIHKNDAISTYIAEKIKNKLSFSDADNSKIVISVGGDGTILRAIHENIDRIDDIIIFGVMTGHLGFFMDFKKEMIDEMLKSIKNKTYNVHSFNLAEATVHTNGTKKPFIALNEFQIIKSHRVVVFDMLIDGRKFETFRGNGLCFSTPAGSTGMNKSLRGAIVDPLLEAIQVTELASINSNAYRTIGSPLILSKGRKLSLVTETPIRLDFCYDHLMETFDDVHKLTFKLSNKKVKIAYIKDNPFFERVRKAFI